MILQSRSIISSILSSMCSEFIYDFDQWFHLFYPKMNCLSPETHNRIIFEYLREHALSMNVIEPIREQNSLEERWNKRWLNEKWTSINEMRINLILIMNNWFQENVIEPIVSRMRLSWWLESVSFNKTREVDSEWLKTELIISSVVLNSSYWRYKCLWLLIIKIEQKALKKILFLNLSTVDDNNSSYKTMSIKWSFQSTENQSNDILIQQSFQSDNREWLSKRRFLIWY